MPKELNEISGITFIDDHTLACVQDEKGIIFLYDLDKSEVSGKIPFAGKGDYEGIAIANETAYVITGDGILYEVADFLSDPKVSSWNLDLPGNEESEAICYDPEGKRLLLAFKNHQKDQTNPGLFSFDLQTKTLIDSALVQMEFRNADVRKKDRSEYKKLWQPADLAIANGKIYVIDAINAHLMRFSKEGELESLTSIDRKQIRHPEGIAINKEGFIFLCNDANNDGKGKIVKWKN